MKETTLLNLNTRWENHPEEEVELTIEALRQITQAVLYVRAWFYHYLRIRLYLGIIINCANADEGFLAAFLT